MLIFTGMQNQVPDIVKRPLEEKDIQFLKKARNSCYAGLGTSAFFFLFFFAITYYALENFWPPPPAQEGAEGLEKIPFYALFVVCLMMLIGVLRSLWKLYLIRIDQDNGEKLCGTAIFRKGRTVNKVRYLVFDFDRPREIPIYPSFAQLPALPKGEPLYVELAPRSSVGFRLEYKGQMIFIKD